MADIRLICLDFDGTIMAYEDRRGFFHPAAADLLNELGSRGVLWCTNSGRDVKSQLEILRFSWGRGLRHLPSALLCGESLIFEQRVSSYVALEPWNSAVLGRLRVFHERIQKHVRPMLEDWREEYRLAEYLGEHYTVLSVEDTDGQADRLYGEMTAVIGGQAGVLITRNGGWLSVLPDDLGKGNVLKGYMKVAAVPPGRTLAVGDHYNDISMLDGSCATYVGCPGDAVPEVVETVEKAGGYVARAGGPEGTVEVIRHFLAR